MQKPSSSSSSAQRRALWEIQQRYQIPASPGKARQPAGQASSIGRAGLPAGRQARAGKRAASPTLRPAPPRYPGAPSRLRHLAKRLALVLILLLIVGGGIFGYKIIAASNKISTTDRSVLGQLKDLLFRQNAVLAGETDTRINILLIAVGGVGHKGSDLADTIMVASLKPDTHEVALLSIPRDLYVQVPGEEYFSKINAVHAYGESQKKDAGAAVLKEVVEEVTGLPIHYYGRADFTAFKQVIDAVGGVDVTIENAFFDYWHKIDFRAGTEKMSGERALAYVRARYVEGPEGGDFKRAARQQQVLVALQDKIFSVNTAFDFTALNAILNSLSDNLRTDMQLWEMKRFYELGRQVDRSKVRSVVLTTGPKGLLVGTTEVLGGAPASVLKPRTGDYNEIHTLADTIFSLDPDQIAQHAAEAPREVPPPEEGGAPPAIPQATPTPAAKPTVEIRNGTTLTGLAKESSDELTAAGYTVAGIGNAATRDHTETTVYVLDDAYADAAKELADTLKAQTDSGLPGGETGSEAHVLIILGTDARS